MFKALLPLLVLAAGLAGTAAAADADGRFTRGLSGPEYNEAGITRLSDDQVAVLDALVRRDAAARTATSAPPDLPAKFSLRLTPDERRSAGLPSLNSSELARLDALVERHQAGGMARTLLGPPVFASPVSRLTPAETKKGREIHGTFSLGIGFGKGGYSERSGGMTLTMDDPDRRYSVTVSYSETRIKSPNGLYDYRADPVLTDPLRSSPFRDDRLREYPGGPDPFIRR